MSAKVEFVGTDLVGSFDADQDGSASVKLAVKLAHLLKLGARGEFKKFSFEMVGPKLVLVGDINGDGSQDIVLEVDGLESFDEIMKKVKA